jgi:hypothetical protein
VPQHVEIQREVGKLLPNWGTGAKMWPEQGLGASVTGYEGHEDEACITHRKPSPNFYPLNSHLITLTVNATLDRSVPFIHSVSPTSDPSKQISW